MVTTLGTYDHENEAIVACPASVLATNKRFKKAHSMITHKNVAHFVYHKNCVITKSDIPVMKCTSHIARQDVYHLTEDDVKIINTIGIESCPGVNFYKVPKKYVYSLSSHGNGFVSIDENRFMLTELQKQYNIPNDVLNDIHSRVWSAKTNIHHLHSEFDESEEDDMVFSPFSD